MCRLVHCRLRSGFVLLEVILALALFTTVATAMTIAMNQLAASTLSARRESILLRRLQSEVAEIAHQPRLDLGRSESPPDPQGVAVTREIERIEAKSESGVVLDGLYRIRVSASMSSGPVKRDDLVREMETIEIRFDEIQSAQATPVPQGGQQVPPPPQPNPGTERRPAR